MIPVIRLHEIEGTPFVVPDILRGQMTLAEAVVGDEPFLLDTADEGSFVAPTVVLSGPATSRVSRLWVENFRLIR